MSIVNKRNAFFGWAVWKVAKRAIKRKTKAAVPGVATERAGAGKPAVLAALAALGGAVLVWRRKSGSDEPDGDQSGE